MSKLVLGAIPCSSSEIVGAPVLEVSGTSLALCFEYEDDFDTRFAVRVEFAGVRAFRKRAESLCAAWHIEGAFDTVVEVIDSAWVLELDAELSEHLRGRFPMRHFLLYLDSFGALEVVGSEVVLKPAEVVGAIV